MNLHDLAPAKGSKHSRKRVGRGPGSGQGTTAGRGSKGQKARAGFSRTIGFEGGQMPLIRRVPKRGFTNIFAVRYATVNLGRLAELEGEITPELLAERGLVRGGLPVKVLGGGEVNRPLQVTAHRFSRSARSKIEAAGGRCQELGS